MTAELAPAPDGYVQERWVYAGLRMSAKGKRQHAWHAPNGRGLRFDAKGHHVLGGVYDAVVRRDGERVYLREVTYTGSSDRDCYEPDSLADRAARTQLATAAAERSDAKRDAVEEAVGPLRELAACARTRAERDALATAAMDAIYGGRR